MKRFALALALACVLSGATLAGDGHGPGAPEPVNPPTAGELGPGTIHTGFTSIIVLTILDVVY